MFEKVIIEWIDSNAEFGWVSRYDAKVNIILCKSIGFVIDENEEGIALAQSIAMDEGVKPFAEIISIPKIAIKNRKKL